MRDDDRQKDFWTIILFCVVATLLFWDCGKQVRLYVIFVRFNDDMRDIQSLGRFD